MILNKWILCSATGALMASAVLTGCGGAGNNTNDATSSDATNSDATNNAMSNTAMSSGDDSTSSGVKLTGAGATFPALIYTKWFDTYKEKNKVEINYQSIGSGAGIKQLKNKTVDFGASDIALSDEDLKEMPAEVVQIPTVGGAVVVVYNLDGVTKGLKLSGEVLADIFLGKITRWNDAKIVALNSGVAFPNRAISVAHRSDGSGTTNIFTTYLAGISGDWKTKVGAGKSVDWPAGIGGKGNDGVAAIVKGAKGSIGYVELAYATQNKLSYAAIRNSAGQFITPSVEATTSAVQDATAALQKDIRTPIANGKGAKSYPISGLTYILVYKKQSDAAKAKALKEFLTWAMKDGQSMGKALEYAPLPAPVVAINTKAISSIQ